MIKHECGCIEKETRKRDGNMLYITTTKIKTCKMHKDREIKQEEKIKKFKKFPNKKSKRIFTLLNNMIDKLYDDGVDVSYFPSEAKKTLKQYAIKIEKLK